MIPAARTRALVVAVQKFENEKWNLSTPYKDACRFIRLLLAQGVPAENITFLAARQRTAGSEEPPVPVEELANSSIAHVQKAISRLAAEETDLLWVYWSGHGLTDSSGKHLLVLPEATRSALNCLDLENLLSTLQSLHLGSGTRNVVVVVDACRNHLSERLSRLANGLTLFSLFTAVAHREMAVLSAAGPGRKTRHSAEGGDFSGRFFELFEHLSPGTKPDILGLYENFGLPARVAADGTSRPQVPGLDLRNWEGDTFVWREKEFLVKTKVDYLNEVIRLLSDTLLTSQDERSTLATQLFVDLPGENRIPCPRVGASLRELCWFAAYADHGLATLTDATRKNSEAGIRAPELGRLADHAHAISGGEWLGQRDFTEIVHLLSAYRTRPLHQICENAYVTDQMTPEHLVRAIESTHGRPSDTALHPLVKLAENAAQTADDPEISRLLRAWSTSALESRGLNDEILREYRRELDTRSLWTPTQKTHIRFNINVNKESGTKKPRLSFTCEGYVFKKDRRTADRFTLATPKSAGGAVTETTENEPARLPFMYWKKLARLIAATVVKHHDELTIIEFSLPLEYIETEVERIKTGRGDGGTGTAIGIQFPTVVCLRERRQDTHEQWRRRWAFLCSLQRSAPQGDGPPKGFKVQDHWHEHQIPGGTIPEDRSCIHFLSTYQEDSLRTLLEDCLNGGIPAAVWYRRKEAPKRNNTPSLAGLQQSNPVGGLPWHVLEHRQNSPEGHRRLILLWDDPHNRVPDLNYHSHARGEQDL
jgi:hypothetical protein